jgi:hypothetical protein
MPPRFLTDHHRRFLLTAKITVTTQKAASTDFWLAVTLNRRTTTQPVYVPRYHKRVREIQVTHQLKLRSLDNSAA